MKLIEKFNSVEIPQRFYWFNEPDRFNFSDGLEIYTNEKTDFWQKTHYGFERDDGHCLFTRVPGDFSLYTHVEYKPETQYDQCGLMVRTDKENWIKVSTEYESKQVSRLGSVVTNLGYSDWATQDISSDYKEMWYRINKEDKDFLLEFSFDGEVWSQMRIAHLHMVKKELEVGVYACSPLGRMFRCKFWDIRIDESTWQHD